MHYLKIIQQEGEMIHPFRHYSGLRVLCIWESQKLISPHKNKLRVQEKSKNKNEKTRLLSKHLRNYSYLSWI